MDMSHLLSAFVVRPEDIRFEVQQPEEVVVLLLRAHPITTLSFILTSILIAISPVILRIGLPFIGINIAIPAVGQILQILTLVLELLALGYLFERFLDWYFSVYIVTNIRIIDIDFSNIANRKISETKLSDIEDKTVIQNGIFRSIFNYGDLLIQTAGPTHEFTFYSIPRPVEVQQIISELEPESGGE